MGFPDINSPPPLTKKPHKSFGRPLKFPTLSHMGSFTRSGPNPWALITWEQQCLSYTISVGWMVIQPIPAARFKLLCSVKVVYSNMFLEWNIQIYTTKYYQVPNFPPTWSLVAFSLHWPLIPEVQSVHWCLVVLAPPGCTVKHYEQQPNSASNCNYLSHFKHYTAHTAVTGESPRHIQKCGGRQTSKVKEQVCLLSFIVELFTALLAQRSLVATSGIFDFPQLKLHISCFHFP